MLKKLSKFLLLSLLIFVLSTSSFSCLADETVKNTNTVTTTETNTTDEITSIMPEIHYGNLYLFGNDIVMDKYVDGNVFIFGKTVNITGQVKGNLFVFAKNLSFDESLIMNSIFACADSIYYNAGTLEGDFYVATKKLEMTHESFVAGNLKALSSDIIFKSAIGKNVDLLCATLELGTAPYTPIIYGNFNYSTRQEISIPEDLVLGTINYTSSALNILAFIFYIFSTCTLTSVAIYAIVSKCSILNCIQKHFNAKLSAIKLLKSLGIGLVFILVTLILFKLLLITKIGILLAIILAALFFAIALTSIPTLTIYITNSIKNLLKIEKVYVHYLILTLVNICFISVSMIPSFFGFFGIISSVIIISLIFISSIGLVVINYIPHKKLSEEEKVSLEEAKKAKKETKNKEKAEKKIKKEEIQKDKKQEKSNK